MASVHVVASMRVLLRMFGIARFSWCFGVLVSVMVFMGHDPVSFA
jgi:hypothetical protein